MAFVKGHAKVGGRPPGGSNKVTATLRDMILGALSDAGGQKYLEKQSRDNPQAFMSLLGRVLPTTLAADPKNPPKFVLTWDTSAPAANPQVAETDA